MAITLKAKQLINAALETGTLDVPSHMAWGSGSATFVETGSALSAEVERNAVSATDRQSTTIEWTSTLGTGEANGVTLREIGLFNDATAGDMYLRQVIYPISKTSSFEYDTLARIRGK